MIVKARVPFLNLHQAGTDAAGVQIPGSSAKAPIGDFRSANEITIGHSHLSRQARPDECGHSGRRSAASRPHPALFYRRAFDGGDATSGTLLLRERLNTTGRCTSADAVAYASMGTNPPTSQKTTSGRLGSPHLRVPLPRIMRAPAHRRFASPDHIPQRVRSSFCAVNRVRYRSVPGLCPSCLRPSAIAASISCECEQSKLLAAARRATAEW
jgi:hypothetical protein